MTAESLDQVVSVVINDCIHPEEPMMTPDRAIAILFCLLCVQCGATPDDDALALAEGEIDSTQQAIHGGAVISDPTHMGFFSLQVWSTTLQRYWTHCTGVLTNNDRGLTAEHCLNHPSLSGRTIYAKMGSQSRKIVVAHVDHSHWDLSVVKFSAPFVMPNWVLDHYTTNPPQYGTTGFARAVYGGTNASLNNKLVLCYGFGGATESAPEPPLTVAFQRALYGRPGIRPEDQVHLVPLYSNQYPVGGDSGMACVSEWGFGAPIALIMEGCTSAGGGFCYGAGAESWALWAYVTLLTI